LYLYRKQDDEALFVDDANAEQRNGTDVTSTDPKLDFMFKNKKH